LSCQKLLFTKNIIIHFLFVAATFNVYCQTGKYSLEVTPFLRYDKQGSFFSWETVIGGKNYVSTKGVSYGLNLNIQRNIKGENAVYVGTGFYKHRISKINRYNDNGTGNSRLINFPSPLFIPFFTDKYSYNTICFNAGYEKGIKVAKNNFIIVGADIAALYLFSQKYHLTNNPEGSTDYKRNNANFWGVMAGLDFGIAKRYDKWNVVPKLKIPVLTFLQTDSAFPNENDADFRKQLFSGLGFGISFIYKVKNLKK
jgi:hypothetical protein